MAQCKGQQRGAVGQAAEALKAALTAKLQPGVKDSPINNGLIQAIKLVEAFLLSHKESPQELESLKMQIKRIMMRQIAGPSNAPPAASERRSKSASPAAKAAAKGAPTGRSAAQKQQQESPSGAGPGGAAGAGGPLQLYSRSSSRSLGSASLDWTLPQRLLNRKAYIQGGDFARMALVQDDLARRAERLREAEEGQRKVATRAMYNEQLEGVRRRREEEREARRREQLEMDEELRQYQASEQERLQRERQAQASLRNFYAGQVSEQQLRRRQEDEARHREHDAERRRQEELEARERARLERLAAENGALRSRLQGELRSAMEAKAAARAAQVEEEKRYNAEYVKKMDADEAARRRVVEVRQEKMRAAFERAGGVALQDMMEEQARQEEARRQRLAAETEAAATERERSERERRRAREEEALRVLDSQIAAKEAEKRAAAEQAAALQEEIRVAAAAAKAREEEAKAARRRAKEEALAAQKAAVAEQHRRRYQESLEPFDERQKWLHAAPLQGTQRAFNNLGVPAAKAALLAGMAL